MTIEPIESLRWLGVISMTVVAITALLILYAQPLGRNASVSAHLAAGKWQYYTMATVLTLAATGFYSFIVGWLGPFYDVNAGFYIIAALGLVSTYLAAWIPMGSESHGMTHTMHMTTAAIAGLVMPIMIGFVYWADQVNGVFAGVLSIVMMLIATIFLLLYVFVRASREQFLVYQTIYVALFTLTITALTIDI